MDIFDQKAHKYVDSFGEVLPGYKYIYTNRQDFFSEVYYDFCFVNLNGEIPIEPPIVGGACGFTIKRKTFKTEMITVTNLNLLKQHQKDLEHVYKKVCDIIDNSKSLSWLKTKYNLNSIELLKIKNSLSKSHFNKQNVIEKLNQLILKNK